MRNRSPAEMRRILSAPFLSQRDLLAVTERYGWTYYRTAKVYQAIRETYRRMAEERGLLALDGYVPSSVAFSYLSLLGIDRDRLAEGEP